MYVLYRDCFAVTSELRLDAMCETYFKKTGDMPEIDEVAWAIEEYGRYDCDDNEGIPWTIMKFSPHQLPPDRVEPWKEPK